MINESSPKVKAYASKLFKHCMDMGGNVTIHHYCNDPTKDPLDGPYKCKLIFDS